MKSYFYEGRNGKLKKFLFCVRGCKQPYKQEDLGIIKITDKMHICTECAKELNLSEKIGLFFDVNLKNRSNINNKENMNVIQNRESRDKKTSFKQKKEKNIAYIVRCKDSTYYCGVTSDLKKAINSLNWMSGPKSMRDRSRLPVVLEKKFNCKNEKEAREKKKEIENKLQKKTKRSFKFI